MLIFRNSLCKIYYLSLARPDLIRGIESIEGHAERVTLILIYFSLGTKV